MIQFSTRAQSPHTIIDIYDDDTANFPRFDKYNSVLPGVNPGQAAGGAAPYKDATDLRLWKVVNQLINGLPTSSSQNKRRLLSSIGANTVAPDPYPTQFPTPNSTNDFVTNIDFTASFSLTITTYLIVNDWTSVNCSNFGCVLTSSVASELASAFYPAPDAWCCAAIPTSGTVRHEPFISSSSVPDRDDVVMLTIPNPYMAYTTSRKQIGKTKAGDDIRLQLLQGQNLGIRTAMVDVDTGDLYAYIRSNGNSEAHRQVTSGGFGGSPLTGHALYGLPPQAYVLAATTVVGTAGTGSATVDVVVRLYDWQDNLLSTTTVDTLNVNAIFDTPFPNQTRVRGKFTVDLTGIDATGAFYWEISVENWSGVNGTISGPTFSSYCKTPSMWLDRPTMPGSPYSNSPLAPRWIVKVSP